MRGLPGNRPWVTQRSPPVETFAQLPPSSKVRPLLLPLLGGEGWGEGSSGQPSLGLRKGLLWARVGVRVFRGSVPPVGTSRWSAQPPPNPSPGGEGWGEGSSGQPPLGYAKVSPCGDLCTTPPVLEGAAALAPSPGGEGWGEGSSGQPSLGLRKGLLWERVGVRVFPGSVPPVGTSRWSAQPPPNPSPGGEGWGEGSSGQPPLGYAKVSPRGGVAADLGRRPAGQGPQHGPPRGLSGSPAEPPAGRHSLSHGWRMREPMACWIRPPAKVRGGPSAAVVTTL